MKRQDMAFMPDGCTPPLLAPHDGIVYAGRLGASTCLAVYKVYILGGSNHTYAHYFHKDHECPLLMSSVSLVHFYLELQGHTKDKDYKALAGLLERVCAALEVARLLPEEIWPCRQEGIDLLAVEKAAILQLGLPEPAFTWAR